MYNCKHTIPDNDGHQPIAIGYLSDSGDLKMSIPNIVSNKHDLLQMLVKIGCILKQTLFTLHKLFLFQALLIMLFLS